MPESSFTRIRKACSESPRRSQRLPGAEVHATSADGKLVVTLEAPSAREIAARIDEIQQLDAVLSASLVYQHNESLEAMMEEVSA